MKMMNKTVLGILKTMAKTPDVKKTSVTWIESKKQMVSLLNVQLRKQKVDDNSIIVQVNDSHMGIHNFVSWVSNLRFYQITFRTNLMFYVIYC